MAVDVAARIIELDRAWEDAISAEDGDAMAALASDDLIYTHAGGTVEGKEDFIGHVLDGPLRFPRIEYEDVVVRVRGEAAVLTGELHLETMDRDGIPGSLHFRFTHVWGREDGAWRLLANQSTFLPPAG